MALPTTNVLMGGCACGRLCLVLCSPLDYNLPKSSVHGIFEVGILESVTIPSLGHLPDSGIEPTSPECPALADGFFTIFTTAPPGKPNVRMSFSPWLLPASVSPGWVPVISLLSGTLRYQYQYLQYQQVYLTKVPFKLLPLLCISDHVNLCTPFKSGVFISHNPLSLLNVSPAGFWGSRGLSSWFRAPG